MWFWPVNEIIVLVLRLFLFYVPLACFRVPQVEYHWLMWPIRCWLLIYKPELNLYIVLMSWDQPN